LRLGNVYSQTIQNLYRKIESILHLKQNGKLADDLRRIGLGKFVDSPRVRQALGLPVHEMPKLDPEILELKRQARELIKGGQKSAAAKLLDESQLKVEYS